MDRWQGVRTGAASSPGLFHLANFGHNFIIAGFVNRVEPEHQNSQEENYRGYRPQQEANAEQGVFRLDLMGKPPVSPVSTSTPTMEAPSRSASETIATYICIASGILMVVFLAIVLVVFFNLVRKRGIL